MNGKSNVKFLILLPVVSLVSGLFYYLLGLIPMIISYSQLPYYRVTAFVVLNNVARLVLILLFAASIFVVLFIRKKKLCLLGWRDFIFMILLSLVFPLSAYLCSLLSKGITGKYGEVYFVAESIALNVFAYVGICAGIVSILVYLLARTDAKLAAIILVVCYSLFLLLEMIFVFAAANWIIQLISPYTYSPAYTIKAIRVLVFPCGLLKSIFVLQMLFSGLGMKKLPGVICGFAGLTISKFFAPITGAIVELIIMSYAHFAPIYDSLWPYVTQDVVMLSGAFLAMIGMIVTLILTRKNAKKKEAV